MTELKAGSPLKRKTGAIHRGRELVVILHPGFMELRERGRRVGYSLDYVAAFSCAAKIQAAADRAEKLAKRKGKR